MPQLSLRREKLEAVPHANLYLAWISQPIPNRPIKVEEQRRRGGVFEIIPVQVCLLKNLKALDLSANRIHSIPMDIRLLKTLEVLALANNNIATLPDELYELKQLKRLYLEGNNLTESSILRLKEKLPDTEIITK